MKLYLYLQAKPINEISFQSPLKGFITQQFEEVIYFDADQNSDAFHIQTGINFIEQSDRIILHIEDDGKTALGACSTILEKLRKHAAPLIILYSGQSKMIQTSLKMLKANGYENDFEEQIRAFLSSE